ncbi:MAG: tRNA (N(6)-L-threonylcarbamoyladenosine(37)-C(2))-methylthiotransferase MtaB [Bacteroidales bacterium]|nr:tRNA (N(6)-L-threonylcarbamoyladenosine(37)-C(2))-methylthiotransferase MtaB [Candidatus Colimorpha onthohippi]
MKIAAHTLGCKLNYAETSHIVRQFVSEGFEVVDFREPADVYVVNTCTVTAVAEKKCRTIVRQAIRLNPRALVAVVGCFAQNQAQQVASIPGVRVVLGNNNKYNLLGIVKSMYGIDSLRGVHDLDSLTPLSSTYVDDSQPETFVPVYSIGDRTRSFFKVQDGCDYFCTYCAIPFARGRSRSATIEDTVAVARQIASQGAREVVLTGVNTGTFGLRHGEQFVDLLRQLDQVEGILRYRISSIEPNLITDEIIDFVAASRSFLPHFHIPLQAGSDKVLKLMHRHYDTELYARKLDRIKQVMPHACIAADIMTGFYGEGATEFDITCRFVDQIPISYLHVFTYSERPNTMALRLGERVPMEERRLRTHQLQAISDRKKHLFYSQHIGESRPVLWESYNHGGVMQGFTDNYIRLSCAYDAQRVNQVTDETITMQNLVQNFDE